MKVARWLCNSETQNRLLGGAWADIRQASRQADKQASRQAGKQASRQCQHCTQQQPRYMYEHTSNAPIVRLKLAVLSSSAKSMPSGIPQAFGSNCFGAWPAAAARK